MRRIVFAVLAADFFATVTSSGAAEHHAPHIPYPRGPRFADASIPTSTREAP